MADVDVDDQLQSGIPSAPLAILPHAVTTSRDSQSAREVAVLHMSP
jgi:hypothetical protein